MRLCVNKKTEERYIKAMKNIINESEDEYSYDEHHLKADVLLCKLLRELGYGIIVDEWDKFIKWYS